MPARHCLDHVSIAISVLLLVSRLTDAAQESEALNRVQDLRFALDQILSRPELVRIDGQRIAVAGHSYGANTAMLVAGANPPVKGLAGPRGWVNCR